MTTKKELMKFILELVEDTDIVCVELHEDENERDYCEHHCNVDGVNESCIRRLLAYRRMCLNKQNNQ